MLACFSSYIRNLLVLHLFCILFTNNSNAKLCNEVLNITVKGVQFSRSRVPKYYILRPNGSLEWVTVDYELTQASTTTQISTVYNYSNRGLLDYKHYYFNVLWKLKGKTILDIGTGEGKFIDDLMELPKLLRPKKAVGIDPKIIESDSNLSKKINASITELPLEDQSFDFAFSHLSFFAYEINPLVLEQGLQELLRVLKKGGSVELLGLTPESSSLLKNYLQQGLIQNLNLKSISFENSKINAASFQKP